ncbi:hypothetical protein LPB67_13190 [Undibacterium sp. Jales W-56]|uniref:hypothetical protein n=1 Tax=Undibacterium sp. Jales W-56 TaxID=2897325 RepID=UPI0021CFFFFE|nr:hypothetical protein [Undibacterium sp. Jales W-56]MCU6434726.1 hypothetical protein [Undibacterium sp. Jales W-56]
MMISTPNQAESLRAEIAALAARMIAEDGADYGSAKRRAAKQLLGNQKIRGDVMPDNQQIEQEVREYNAIFLGDSQPQRLRDLRAIALDVMQLLERFNPYLVGAVLNGTAGEHSDIYLHLFTDNGKDVAIFLLNQDIRFEVTENNSSKRHEPVETLSFMYQQEGVHLALYNQDDLRAGGRNERANLAAVTALISESQE